MRAFMLRLGYRKDPDFDRKLTQDVKQSGKKAGDAMSNEFVRSAKKAGSKTPAEIVKELNAQFRARMGRLKALDWQGKIAGPELKREMTKLKTQFNQGITAAQSELRRQGRLTEGANTRFENSLRKVARQTKRTGSAVGGLNRQMRGLRSGAKGLVVGLVGAAGISRAFRFLAESAITFEKAMAQVWTITTATREELVVLTARVSELSTRLPKSAEDLGYGLYQTISAGVSDTAEAFRVLESSARLASAGLVDTSASVKVVTAVMNAYNLKASAAGDITDILFRTVEQGVTDVPQLAAAMGTVLATASQVGLTFEEVGAALSVTTKILRNTDVATTSLNALLFAIIKPSTEAKEIAKKLGIEWNLAAVQAMGFSRWIQHVTTKAEGNTDTLVKLSGSTRAANTAMILAGSGADGFAGALEGMEERAGATDRALEKTNGTLDAQIKMLRNQAEDGWRAWGEAATLAFLKVSNVALAALDAIVLTDARLRRLKAQELAGRTSFADERPAGFGSSDRIAEARTRQAQREAQAERDRADAAEAAAAARERDRDATVALIDRLAEGAEAGSQFAGILARARAELAGAAKDELAGILAQVKAEVDAAEALLARRDAFRERGRGPGRASSFTTEEVDGMRETVRLATENLDRRRRALAEYKKAGAELAKLEEATRDLGKAWEDVLSTVAGIGKGLLNVLDATGKLPDELRSVLRGVIDIAEAWQQIHALKAAGSLTMSAAAGPVAAGIGAVAGIISVFTARSQKEEQQRREQIAAMDRLRESLVDLRDTVQADLSPAAVGSQADLVRRLVDEANRADPRDRAAAREARDKAVRRLLDSLGLDEEAVFDGRSLNIGRLQELLGSLADVSLGVFGEDLTGQLDGLRWVFSALGDTAGDTSAKVARFLEVLERFSPTAAEQLRKATEDSPEAARKLLDSWSEILFAGGDPLEALLAQLGLTAGELQRVIDQSRGLTGDGAGGPVSQSVQLQQSITEIQAVSVIAWLQDIAFSARKLVALMGGGDPRAAIAATAARGASIPSAAGGGSASASVAARTAGMASNAVTVINNWGPFTLDNPHLTPEDLRNAMEKMAADIIRAAGWRNRGGIL